MIDNVVIDFQRKFPDIDWEIASEAPLGGHCIIVDNVDFYLNSKEFKKWTKVFRRKYKEVNFYIVYQKDI